MRARRKQAAIVAALRHSWDAYARHAWGMDELMPLTQAGKNSFGGLGATIVDALDTLWLMGLEAEFQRARDWVVNDLNFNMCAAHCLHAPPDPRCPRCHGAASVLLALRAAAQEGVVTKAA